ncbi:hypothetical protein SEVCU012_1750 [Staphylococcus pettenkoferi VCU012]|nr:hypothetical protein SEVCU012_1750 [Staphylococcus pettenkoferi VCU012]
MISNYLLYSYGKIENLNNSLSRCEIRYIAFILTIDAVDVIS